MERRIDYIDIAKGIGILLVLFGHLLPNNELKIWIYMFHMPLFFIVYGMISKNELFIATVYKRFVGIYIPYILWGLIFAGFTFYNCALLVYGTNKSLISAGSSGMLWFLTVMFFASVLSALVQKIVKEKRNVEFVAIIILVTIGTVIHYVGNFKNYGVPFSANVVFVSAGYIILGKIIADNFDKIYTLLKNNLARTVVSVAFLLVAIFGIFLKTETGYPQMATLDVGFIPIYFIISVLPCLGLMIISKMLSTAKMKKILIFLGQNSMTIFITHRIIVYCLKDLCAEYGVLMYIPAVMVLIAFCSTISALINEFCPWLVGKQKRRTIR